MRSRSTFEEWLKREAAAAYDRLMADPERALPTDDIRAVLDEEYTRAVDAN